MGDLVYVEKGARVPADIILLRTTEVEGSCFLRTDQLDGETDWKKREAITATQKLSDNEILSISDATCYAEAPSKVNAELKTSPGYAPDLFYENLIPGASPIKILQREFYGTRIFGAFWLVEILSRQS